MPFCCELISASALGDRSIGICTCSRIAVSTGTSSGNLQSPVLSICDLHSARPGLPALRPFLDEFWGWSSPWQRLGNWPFNAGTKCLLLVSRSPHQSRKENFTIASGVPQRAHSVAAAAQITRDAARSNDRTCPLLKKTATAAASVCQALVEASK